MIVTPYCNTENANICMHCALCCDGSLFNGLPVSNDDDTAFGECAGGDIFRENNRLFYPQPCNLLNGTSCSFYHDHRRFRACKIFRCKLLKQHLSGEITYGSALTTIREVQTRSQAIMEFARLQGYSPDNRILVLIRDLKQRGTEDPAFRRKYAKQLLDCVILEGLLNERFSKNNSKKESIPYD